MDSYLYSDILDLIERQAERRPDSIAIEDAGDLKLWLIPLSQVVMLYRHQQVWRRPDACRWRSFVGGDSVALAPLACGGSVGR